MNGDEAAKAQAEYAPMPSRDCCEGLPVVVDSVESVPSINSGIMHSTVSGATERIARKSILQEADEVAGQDRSRDYGHPLINHQRIADIWTVQARKLLKPGERFTPRIVALMMVGLKLAREVNSPKRDNLVDIAGYVKCLDMIDEAESFDGNF